MVMQVVLGAMSWIVLLAQQKDPPLKLLDPAQRVAVIMALLALVLTGLFLVMTVMLGAHWVRRLARQRPSNRSASARDATAQNERLRDALASVLPEAKTNDTVHLGKSPGDTRIDR